MSKPPEDAFACAMKCPHCEQAFALTSKVLGDQILTLKLGWEGELMQANTIAGTLSATVKLLEASARDMGAKAQVHVQRVEMADKSISFDLLVMTKRNKK